MIELLFFDAQMKAMLRITAMAALSEYQLGCHRNAIARAEQKHAEFLAMIARMQ